MILGAKNRLKAMPTLNHDELSLGIVTYSSREQMDRAYTLYGEINLNQIYRRNGDQSPFKIGHFVGTEFECFLEIKTKNVAFQCVPTQLGDKYYQVSMVKIAKGYEESGISKLVYE